MNGEMELRGLLADALSWVRGNLPHDNAGRPCPLPGDEDLIRRLRAALAVDGPADAPCGPVPPSEDVAQVLHRLNVARATVQAGGPTDRVLRQAHDLLVTPRPAPAAHPNDVTRERLREVVFGVIDARIVEVAREGYATTEPDRGWDCGIEAASLKEIRSAIAAALAVDAPAGEVDAVRRLPRLVRLICTAETTCTRDATYAKGYDGFAWCDLHAPAPDAPAPDTPADDVAELRAYCEILRRVDGAFRSWLDEFTAAIPPGDPA